MPQYEAFVVSLKENSKADAALAKDVVAVGDPEFGYVVTLCDNAREACPLFRAKIRWSTEDLMIHPRMQRIMKRPWALSTGAG